MNVTNDLGLPEPLVRLVSNGDRSYAPKTVSVTRLLTPPQMVWLESQHEITEDASERIWSSFGRMMHKALEDMGHDNALVEESVSLVADGYTVTGTPDLVEQIGPDQYRVVDFKFVGVATTFSGPRQEWVEQLNFYAYLLHGNGFDVRDLRVCAIYRDWVRSKASDPGYPPPAEMIPIPMWPREWQRSRLLRRLAEYDAALKGVFRECTDEERWVRPAKWAVTKVGNKRAARLLDTREQAEEWAFKNAPVNRDARRWFEISERPGEAVRCQSFCRVARWCQQGGKRDEGGSVAAAAE